MLSRLSRFRASPLQLLGRSMSSWSRLVRFLPTSGGEPLIGEPVDPSLDVGLSTFNGKAIQVDVFSGNSVLSAGERTGRKETVERLLSPLAENEVGTIRCIGLNYLSHAKEMKLEIPKTPVLFSKPSTSLAGPYPEPVVLPKAFVKDDAADYEAELGVILGKDAKNVSEKEAMDYVLGYTAAHDVSSRVVQWTTSQWDFSKSFDGSCPIGPAIVHKSAVGDYKKLSIKGIYNEKTVQDGKLDDLIFSIPQIISFLSQGTTLKAGTLIITGTPFGVGWSAQPRRTLKEGDEFRVEVSGGIGTLINKVVHEQ